MKLYHTGYQEIRIPDLTVGRKNADFGQGFYLTPDRAFAERWAQESRNALPRVNHYSFFLEGLCQSVMAAIGNPLLPYLVSL